MRILTTILLLLGIYSSCYALESFKAAPDSLEWYAIHPDKRPYSLYSNDHAGQADLCVKFNLEQRQSVELEMVDMLGRHITTQKWHEVLDQTFTVEVPDSSNKIFIVRLLIDNRFYTNKIYISK